MNLSKIHITRSWLPFGTAMVVWPNRINVNSKDTLAAYNTLLNALRKKADTWPHLFRYKGNNWQIDKETKRGFLEELAHLKQIDERLQEAKANSRKKPKIFRLINYWWYSRKSIYAYKKAPNEIEAKAWAEKMKTKSPRCVSAALRETICQK